MANTNKGRRFFVCETPKPDDLNQGQFEALTWVEVGHVGMIGESGTATNILNYDELDTDVTQKQKGVSNAGDPDVEVARDYNDVGQVALRAMAATSFNYAFKVMDDDAPSAGYTNTTYYLRGVVVGPKRPNGRVEDFILELYTLGLNQKEIVVDPAAASVPVNTTRPSITGTAVQTGVVLTANEGVWTNDPTSFTYQWQHDVSGNGAYVNVAALGTSKTFTPVVGDVGDSLRVQVTAVNGAGSSAAANSIGTSLQAA